MENERTPHYAFDAFQKLDYNLPLILALGKIAMLAQIFIYKRNLKQYAKIYLIEIPRECERSFGRYMESVTCSRLPRKLGRRSMWIPENYAVHLQVNRIFEILKKICISKYEFVSQNGEKSKLGRDEIQLGELWNNRFL